MDTELVGRAEELAANLKRARHISLKPDWVAACLQFLESSQQQRRGPALEEAVLAQALLSDFNASGAGTLPMDLKTYHRRLLEGKHVLQIDEISNLAAPAKDRYQDRSEGRCLKLHLTDGGALLLSAVAGRCHVFGIEYRHMPSLSWDCPAGCKVVVENVAVRRGVLLLQTENCAVLGGQVDRLEQARQRAVACWNKPAGGRSREHGPRPVVAESIAAAWADPAPDPTAAAPPGPGGVATGPAVPAAGSAGPAAGPPNMGAIMGVAGAPTAGARAGAGTGTAGSSANPAPAGLSPSLPAQPSAAVSQGLNEIIDDSDDCILHSPDHEPLPLEPGPSAHRPPTARGVMSGLLPSHPAGLRSSMPLAPLHPDTEACPLDLQPPDTGSGSREALCGEGWQDPGLGAAALSKPAASTAALGFRARDLPHGAGAGGSWQARALLNRSRRRSAAAGFTSGMLQDFARDPAQAAEAQRSSQAAAQRLRNFHGLMTLRLPDSFSTAASAGVEDSTPQCAGHTPAQEVFGDFANSPSGPVASPVAHRQAGAEWSSVSLVDLVEARDAALVDVAVRADSRLESVHGPNAAAALQGPIRILQGSVLPTGPVRQVLGQAAPGHLATPSQGDLQLRLRHEHHQAA
ncbi:hypothetical protein V8C86DRAFT_3030788 [Haematococcus lacustris]